MKTAYTQAHISRLLVRFMNGETTLGEESQLADYFRTATDVPEQWQDYRQMFAYFDRGMTDVPSADRPQPVRRVVPFHLSRWKGIAVAACFALLIGLPFVLFHQDGLPLADHVQPAAAPVAPTGTKLSARAVMPPVRPETTPVPARSPVSPVRTAAPGEREASSAVQEKPRQPMAEAEAGPDAEVMLEQEIIDRSIAEARFRVINASMQARGYQAVYNEDGSIDYRKPNVNPQNIQEI